jgi:hypothetical protein
MRVSYVVYDPEDDTFLCSNIEQREVHFWTNISFIEENTQYTGLLTYTVENKIDNIEEVLEELMSKSTYEFIKGIESRLLILELPPVDKFFFKTANIDYSKAFR